MVNRKSTVQKASKGVIEGYYNDTNVFNPKDISNGLMPHFDRNKALKSVRKDSIVLASLNTLVDKSLDKGYNIFKDTNQKNEFLTKKLNELKFRRLLRPVFYNLFAYGNVFIENVKDGNDNIKELHILETTITQPVANSHGEILGYTQSEGDNGKTPFWKPEEVTHIALTKLTTGIWGELDIESIYTSVLIKEYVYSYLGWLFGTNQFKSFYNIEEANSDQIKEFLSFVKKAEGNIQKPVIARGKINHQILRDFSDGETILNLLNKCDANILSLMQVPPILIGLPGDSNRSNSDSQERSFFTRINAVQKVVEDEVSFDLFEKIGYKNNYLKFNNLKDVDIGQLLEQAERMKLIGFKSNKVEEFLKENNFPITGSLIDKDLYAPQPMESNEEKSEDMQPSRERKDDGESNEKIGSGEEGTTREDQLVKKGNTHDYSYTEPGKSQDEE